MTLEQEFFDLLHLRGDLHHPGGHRFFLDPLDALDGGERIAVGQQGQAFNDRFLAVVLAVKESPASLGDDLLAGGALPTLAAFTGESELAQIAGIDSTIIRALLIPTKGIRRGELLIIVGLLRDFHSAGDFTQLKAGRLPSVRRFGLRPP